MRISDWSSDVCSSDLFRREDVEVERAVAVRRRAVGRGRDCFHAVQADAGELRAQAAHRDRAALAGVALDRDVGNALQRFGEILVGEFGDILGDDHRSEEHTSELQSLMRNSYALFCLKTKKKT